MLEGHDVLKVAQQVEPLQVFTGFETANRYRVSGANGESIVFAHEESSFLAKQLLRGHRPMTLNVIDDGGQTQMVAQRKFFWFFSHLEMLRSDGSPLARMQQRFSLLARKFDLESIHGSGAGRFTVHGPKFRPNTFWVRRDGTDLAKITKEWSGMVKELATAADNFSVEFYGSPDESLRWIVLGAAFAIDLEFFENRGRSGGISIGR